MSFRIVGTHPKRPIVSVALELDISAGRATLASKWAYSIVDHEPMILELTRQIATRAVEELGCATGVDAVVADPFLVMDVAKCVKTRLDPLIHVPPQRSTTDLDEFL